VAEPPVAHVSVIKIFVLVSLEHVSSCLSPEILVDTGLWCLQQVRNFSLVTDFISEVSMVIRSVVGSSLGPVD
jgi:hypothetical protein